MNDNGKKIGSFARNIIIMSIVGAVAALICLPFAFFNIHLPGLSIGIVLGTLIEIVCYILLVQGTKLINLSNTKGGTGLVLLFNVLRLLLYIGGLVLAAFATFKWPGNWVNVFAVAGAYLPILFILIIAKLREPKDPKEVK